MRAWLIGLVVVFLGLTAEAIEPPLAPLFVKMTSADGLPSSHVNALASDAAGYLWIGTHDGLARYDGVEFTIYRHAVDDETTLQANSVQVLHVDSHDRVWAGVEDGGVGMLDSDRRGFRRYSPESYSGFLLSDVWAITSQPDDVIWFGGYAGGLHRIDMRTDTLEVIRADPEDEDGLPADHILDLLALPDGRLFIATSSGLAILRDGEFEPAPPFHHPKPGMVLSLLEEPDGSILVGTQSGVERLENGRFVPMHEDAAEQKLVASGVMTMHRDRRGKHWFGTRTGLRHVHDGKLRDAGGYAALATPEMVLDILEDHEGGLWFAVRNVGLMRLLPDWKNFSVLHQGEREQGGLHSNAIADTSADGRGGLWLIHRDGVLEHVGEGGEISRYLDTADTRQPIHSANAVLARPDGKVWLGHVRGLSLFDPLTGSITDWRTDSAQDASLPGPLRTMRHDAQGYAWLSFYGGGLQRRNADGKVLRTWESGAQDGLPTGSVEDMVFDQDGRLWLAGDFGVLRLDAGGENFIAVPGVDAGRRMGIGFTPDGDLWAVRLGFLERYAVRGETAELLERVDDAKGLPVVEIGGVLVDRLGDVWLTSIRGLWRYSSAGGAVRKFGVSAGLPGEEFNVVPPRQTDSGVVIALSTEGAVIFDPTRIELSQTEPRLALKDVSVLRPDGRSELPIAEPVQLSWADREFSVRARLLSFADAPSNRYRFRLQGFESHWVDVGARGERVFSQLPPGQYVLEVVGGNSLDVWSAPPLRLPVYVEAPWWQRGWAYSLFGLAGLAALGFGVLAYRARLSRRHQFELAQRQREWAERASQAKSSFLATMGHEIRTPMSGVLGMAELLMKTPLDERQRGYVEAIQRSGDLMLRLVNDALDLARIEAGKLTLGSEAFDLHALATQSVQLMRPLAKRKGLAMQFVIQPEVPQWVLGDGQRVQQIVLNLISNAVKFTDTGEVNIRVQYPADSILISVQDTGPGLDAEQQERLFQRFEQMEGELSDRRHGGSGLGLAISQELASAMGGLIQVDSTLGQGATFHFRVPLPEVAAPGLKPSEQAAASQGHDILLVEDDEIVAQVIVGLLQDQGHRVVHAAHGLVALSELRRQQFSLVFLDIDLPGINGFEIARLIASEADAPPVIALTARSDSGDEERAAASGMQGFLRKPVRGDDLAAAIRQFVG